MTNSPYLFWLSVVLLIGCERTAPRIVPVAPKTSVTVEDSPDADAPFSDYQFREDGRVSVPVPSGEFLRKATACTVRLGGSDDAGGSFDGSGVIIHRHNSTIYVLTVAHAAAEGIDSVELFSLASLPKPSAKFTDSQIEVVSMDDRADLALIRVTVDAETELETVSLAKPDSQRMGYSVGCVGKNPPKVISEQINAADYFTIKLPGGNTKRFMWETEKPQNQGRSGGPLLNVKGGLLGIALGKVGGFGYYSHVLEISEYLVDNDLGELVTYAELLRTPQGK